MMCLAERYYVESLIIDNFCGVSKIFTHVKLY